MAFIQGFGRYLPERVLGNAELAARLGCEAGWIVEACGIEERRIAGPDETVAAMAERAARACLAGAAPGLVIVASGTAERRFPGPAAEVALRLGFAGVPAIDLPLASAGGLFGMGLAAQLAPAYGRVLVVAAERMSEAVLGEAPDRNTAILFGDGAGAVLVTADAGPLEIVDSVLHSDGGYTEALRLGLSGGLQMDGRAVILQASRRIPAGISEVLGRNGVAAGEVGTFVLHQANRNLMERVARGVGVPVSRFYSNIGRYGNTSSASMLIAASEWWDGGRPGAGEWVCFGAFGAGFHWGAVLARG